MSPAAGAAVPGPSGAWRPPVWSLAPAAALAWWLVGHLPWLLHGADRAAPLAVPLRAGLLSGLVLGSLAGGVLAGLLCVLAAPERRWPGVLATGSGTAAAVAATLGQSVVASGQGAGFDADRRVLTGLVVVSTGVAALAWAVGSLAALGPAGAGVGLALVAGVLPGWLTALVAPLLPFEALLPVGALAGWVQAAVLAAALVVVGVLPIARLALWPVVVLVTWSTGPVLTSITYLEPSLQPGAGLPRGTGDTLAGAAQVLWLSASPLVRDLLPWVVAVVAAVFVAVLRAGSRGCPRVLAGLSAPPR